MPKSSTSTGDEIGGNEALANAVTEVLRHRNWSLRRASIATGVHYSTIERMGRGVNVEAEGIARFAFKISEPEQQYETVLHWLRLAGKDDFVSILRAAAETAKDVPPQAKKSVSINSREMLILPSGREIPSSAENIQLLETIFTALEKAKQNP